MCLCARVCVCVFAPICVRECVRLSYQSMCCHSNLSAQTNSFITYDLYYGDNGKISQVSDSLSFMNSHTRTHDRSHLLSLRCRRLTMRATRKAGRLTSMTILTGSSRPSMQMGGREMERERKRERDIVKESVRERERV